MKISVGFLVAYDFELLKTALPLIYARANHIILVIDKDRLSLKGNLFYFNEHFIQWVKEIDEAGKIVWVEESFYSPERNPHDAELFMRNYMLQQMPVSDWYFQFDPDEYVLDFNGMTERLLTLDYDSNKPTVIEANWITLFKQNKSGFFIIGGTREKVRIATNRAYNTDNRMIADAQVVQLDYNILHQSWSRTSQEVWQKLSNWSHTQDFDIQKFFRLWKRCHLFNYQFYWQFHPLNGPIWQYLLYVQASDIQVLIDNLQKHPLTWEIREWPVGWKRMVHRLGRIFWKLP
jgi:hypothetical protein